MNSRFLMRQMQLKEMAKMFHWLMAKLIEVLGATL